MYGLGIDERFRFSNLLQKWLGETREIEVINLGVSGNQSTDTLELVKKFVPVIKPDQVLYGVCQNDFLPSGLSRSENYQIPLPEDFKKYLVSHFKIVALTNDIYEKVLLKLNLNTNFYKDIFYHFPKYQIRFKNDVKAMNQFIIEQGLPPMSAIVLDQVPKHGGRRQN